MYGYNIGLILKGSKIIFTVKISCHLMQSAQQVFFFLFIYHLFIIYLTSIYLFCYSFIFLLIIHSFNNYWLNYYLYINLIYFIWFISYFKLLLVKMYFIFAMWL